MTIQERIRAYTRLAPHSADDFANAALALDEEHRSGDITAAELSGRLATLAALHRDLRSRPSAAARRR